ncbi:MAG: DEAD/DEAH box helicase [Pseudohongiellaceae bacterium]
MIPGLLAQDVAKSLREFIVTGFETDTWPFAGKFEQLVTHDNGEAFIKGPYLSINLPFAKTTERKDFFSGFQTQHSPFVHQEIAWSNLYDGDAKNNKQPQSTIVSTSTGSGKTECFLYPLLNHCLHSQNPGIKAIVIYPLNALAQDQAKRFANIVHSAVELKGKIRVGLFIGGEDDEKTMGETHVITPKNILRKRPPDILLTNYKMLDFLLMRPADQQLWRYNTPDSLKYLVVDELHTFDGAQGSDLAMLIRRLKARLKVTTESLTCVGTSATLGDETQRDALADYASDIFNTRFEKNNIIGESRESHEQFLGMIEHMMLDPSFTLAELKYDSYASPDEYLIAQTKFFFGDDWILIPQNTDSRQQLGMRLKKHLLMHNLLKACSQGSAPVREILGAIKKIIPAQLEPGQDENVVAVLVSFLSLLSHARGDRYPGEPFVTVGLHLWSRELRRIVARVGTDTAQNPVHLLFSDDLKSRSENEEQRDIYLPIVQCTECHSTAWLTTVELGENHIEQDLRKIYTRFFSHDKRVQILLPLKNPNYRPAARGIVKYLCSDCGNLQTKDGKCASCGEESLVTVYEPNLIREVRRGGIPTHESQRTCPVCLMDNSLLLFGSRAASLSSVAIHQMFANKINDDKKLIAFSDSVQDAAHRGGFFAARTWRTNFRMALAKAVNHYCNSHNGLIPLPKLYDYLPEYWLTEPQNPDRFTQLNYITQLIPPSMQAHDDYMNLTEQGDMDDPLPLIDLINKRLVWEILSELGFRSLVGRSLDRTGVATIYWDPMLIKTAAQKLESLCHEKMGYPMSQQSANYVLWGITSRMKRQGAIYNHLMKSYIENGGDWFLLPRISLFMPPMGSYSALPRFPGEMAEKGLDRLLPSKQGTWYSRWVQQFLDGSQLNDNNFITDLLRLIMGVLVEVNLLIEIPTNKGNKAWALNPDQLSITNKLKNVRLRQKRIIDAGGEDESSISSAFGFWYLPETWIEYINGMPSLNQLFLKQQALAVYEPDAHPRPSMYRDDYETGQIRRVIGHEHTALLERKKREELEHRFMAGPETRKDWYENLLSATSTLEMGIDIGDLSSVLLCSVPPAQANYLQRAGRAGRRDGNSFVLTLANGRPHDLFFYADPLKMLAANIQTPAIFLNAVMVLRRQFLAFGFDCWGVHSGGEHIIPGYMQAVLDAVENSDQKRFPYTLLDFIAKHRDELWEKFSAMLSGDAEPETLATLKAHLFGTGISNDEDPLHIYVLDRIKQVVEERKNLLRQQKDLTSEIRALKKKPEDEARDKLERELDMEIEGIKELKKNLNRKDTLNFFTDEGLLPNYAFPEEGTTLRSVIFRRLSKPAQQEDGKTTNYKTSTYEYSRPAHAALDELAPESIFYASNRKVQIERIEMARGENLENWRLCPSCNYSEHLIGADTRAACPRCHDPMWANVSQQVNMVRLRQVYANTSEDKALIGDDSDTREPTFYNRQMLIDFEPAEVSLAYAMQTDTRAFGFEFIKKAQFREINFGKHNDNDQLIGVAGMEMPRPGFKLCKECGKVQSHRDRIEHQFKCSYKKAQAENAVRESASDGIIDCLYLYREYESEAIRILMPRLSLSNHEAQIQSFVAAIQLGLKSHFRGKVDHIHIMKSDEPIPESADRANYLVLYDAVPGGTGYLHTLLADPTKLMGTLTLARDIMAKCDCQDNPDMDGCYNCLFAYRNSYGMENTSRRVALNMLNDILDENVELKPVNSLSKINKNVWVDSELERRFPEALRALSQNPHLDKLRIRVTKDVIRGKVGFKLEIGDLIYSVEPQASLTAKDGVAYACKPDFLISLDRESESKIRVAVFLDGYSHHKDIVHEDLMKRQGIFLGSDMLTWSLTWYDVNDAFAGNETKIPNVLRENTANRPAKFIDQISKSQELQEHNKIAELSPLLMLVKFLSQPDIEKWRSYAMLRALCWLNQTTMQSDEEMADYKKQWQIWPSQYVDNFSDKELIFCSSNKLLEKSADLAVHIAGEKAAITELDAHSLLLTAIFDPKDTDKEQTKTAWQKLLQIVNIGQFLPFFFAGTVQGINNGDFAKLEWHKAKVEITHDDWDKIATLADNDISEIIDALAAAKAPLPEVGYELVNDKGMSIGEAELAWEKFKVAFMLEYQKQEGGSEFEKMGWHIVTADDGADILIKKLEGENND